MVSSVAVPEECAGFDSVNAASVPSSSDVDVNDKLSPTLPPVAVRSTSFDASDP
jgi:hypothetical protein